MATYRKLTQSQLFAHIRKHGATEVHFMPSKMYFNLDHAYTVTLDKNNNNDIVTVAHPDRNSGHPVAFAVIYNAWAYHNTFSEVGYYAHYYIKV